MRSAVLAAVLTVLVAAAPAAAAPLTPEQALNRVDLSGSGQTGLAVSPDGNRAAFVVVDAPEGKGRAQNIWLFDRQSGQTVALTHGTHVNRAPRWSPDGRTLAFLSNRAGAPQIYLLPLGGGEARPLTKGDDGISTFAWAPDGTSIAFLSPEPKRDVMPPGGKDDDAQVVDRDDRPDRLWIVNVASGERRVITPAGWAIDELQWMPDGTRVIVSATNQPANDRETNRIDFVSIDKGTLSEIAAPRGPFGSLTLSPDGATLAYLGARVDGPEPTDIYVLPVSGGAPRNLTATSVNRPIRQFAWQPDGSLLAVVADGFKSRLDRIAMDGSRTPGAREPVNPEAIGLMADHTLAFTGETTTTAPELWVQSGSEAARAVTHLNGGWGDIPVIAPRFVHYTSFDGTDIEAALLEPPARSGPVPLIVLVHGGPTGRWSDSFEAWGQLLAARGYAILYPNIRGSTGYGESFVETNRADWGGADFKDVMAGVDAMIKQGIADPARLGIGGWSYGGYMAEWAITQTDRFKAAVTGAGMANLMSEFGTERGPSYDYWFWDVPYEKPDGFLQHSPVMFAKHAHTPTLILQGENDHTDPIGQSQELYRALKWYGVETELVLYPREDHGFRERAHLLDRLHRIVDWYEAHLGPTRGTRQ
jgi:dipeptidyl aminopeptidase/acylaminoacyl peptidase